LSIVQLSLNPVKADTILEKDHCSVSAIGLLDNLPVMTDAIDLNFLSCYQSPGGATVPL
jgi:hypothetical protein